MYPDRLCVHKYTYCPATNKQYFINAAVQYPQKTGSLVSQSALSCIGHPLAASGAPQGWTAKLRLGGISSLCRFGWIYTVTSAQNVVPNTADEKFSFAALLGHVLSECPSCCPNLHQLRVVAATAEKSYCTVAQVLRENLHPELHCML